MSKAELPHNKLTFLDKLKIGFNLLPLRKCTEDLRWDIVELMVKPYSSDNHCLGTAEITIYHLWKI
jgi:hypothetical protein